MKEFEEWDIEDLTHLFNIIDSAHKAKNVKKLSQILDELSGLYELLGEIDIKKIGNLLRKLADILVERTNENLGDQEKT
jgi:hypothetical protein